MAEILVASFSDLKNDPRVHRQIGALASRHDVTAAGFTNPSMNGVRFVQCARPDSSWAGKLADALQLGLRRYERFYWHLPQVRELLAKLSGKRFDLIVANELDTVPLAIQLSRGAKVIFDAHEYSPREFEDRPLWKIFRQPFIYDLCRRYLGQMAAMTTVSRGVAEEFKRVFGIDALVIANVPYYKALAPSKTRGGEFRMLHHGVAMPSRKLERMIELVDLLDSRFHLDFMLIPGPAGYLEHVRARARGNRRVRFLPAIAMQELVEFGNSYDIGVFLLEPANFNYRYALPNKFFEFIQSRLAVAIGPSPEMMSIVRRYDCGVVAETFSPETLARVLGKLDARKVDYFKHQSHIAARELCFERVSETLLKLVDDVLEER